MAALLTYDDASAVIAAHVAKLNPGMTGAEHVDLATAFNRNLAEPVLADRDMPPFPRSTRDGFACRAGEASGGRLLPIAGSIRAGDPPAAPLPAGTAWEIMTGAAVPDGADAVAMLEHVEHQGDAIRLSPGRKLEPSENIVSTGSEARAGDELISPGSRLSAAHLAAAAACGHATLSVFQRPRVAILTTGDELVPITATPGPGQIRNSNAPMLAAMVERCGGQPWILPPARDDAVDIEAALREGARAHMMLISGGVSAGKFDLVEPALLKLGAQFHFTGVRIQPGKPLVFGEMPHAAGSASIPLFGLPGNPISSAATFLLFAAPVLAALAGNAARGPRFGLARLSRSVKGRPDLTRFVPATRASDGTYVEPVGTQGSGDLAAFARADCFVMVPEGAERLDSGEVARILLF